MAPNFSLAKIASDFNKPNGQCFVDPSQVLEFVRPLPVRKIPGIGRVTEKVLNAFDIITVQDLYDRRGLVNWMFQPATREFLLRASVGCMGSSSSSTEDLEDDQGNNNSNEPDHQKGISRERTFQANDCWTTLNCKLEDVARMLSQDMIRKKVLAHTVTVKVKLATFNVYSRSKSLKRGVYIQTHHELIAVAASMMAQIRSDHFATFLKNGKKNSFSCRLLGIRCSNLVEEDEVSNSQKESIEKFLSKSPPAPTTTCTTSTTCGEPSETIHTQSVVTGPPQRKILEFPTKEASSRSKNQMVSCSPAVGVYEANDPPSKTNIMAQAVSPEEHVACPLCRRKFPLADNSALNQHIDSCLSGSTVRQAVRECKDPSKKRQRLTDWWIQ
jgi:DNA polymerase kappa